MFAPRARSSALLAEHSARSRTIRPGTGVPSKSAFVHAPAPRSSLPCNRQMKCDRYHATLLSSAPYALFLRAFARERKLTPLLSRERAPLRSGSLRQPIYLQAVAHPSASVKILTPMFPSSCTLFARSFAKERKLTNLYSVGCARFCENRGYLGPSKPNPRPANGFCGCYSRSEKKSEGLSKQP